MPSSRLLPTRSGIARCVSSSTLTNPGWSPFGETSQRPPASDVPRIRNGAWAMKVRQCASSRGRSLPSARSLGCPSTARSRSSESTIFSKFLAPMRILRALAYSAPTLAP